MKTPSQLSLVLAAFLVGCASSPQVVVDPSSIKDAGKYERDFAECKAVAEGYDVTQATAGSAALGAGAALGTAALVLATGGMYLLPSGVAVVAGGGAAAGGSVSKNRESRAREKIWAQCLTDRGYKSYTSN